MSRAEVYALIDAERARQASLWTERHDWGQGDCSKGTAVSVTSSRAEISAILEKHGCRTMMWATAPARGRSHLGVQTR